MTRDPLSIVETAYVADGELDAWLARLAEASARVMDRGFGVYAHTFEIDDASRVHHPSIQAAGNWSRELMQIGGAMQGELAETPTGRESMAKLYPRAPTVASFMELSGMSSRRHASASRGAMPPAALDAFGVIGSNPTGRGVIVHAITPARARVSPRERSLWLSVAVHLAAAYRLRTRDDATVDAVLAPDGRVAHADARAKSKDALASLRNETRAIDRARGKMRRASPDEALAIWKGLVDGEWSLVDHVDSDGRRYIFAKRNAPEVRPWNDLTDRERQVVAYAAEGQSLKVIAYELGIGASTVSTLLKSAASKLAIRSRPELVRAYRRFIAGER